MKISKSFLMFWLVVMTFLIVVNLVNKKDDKKEEERTEKISEKILKESEKVGGDEESLSFEREGEAEVEEQKEKVQKDKKPKTKKQRIKKQETKASNNSDYILSDSSNRTLEWTELEGMSKYELRIARNEIYARYGRKFTSKDLQRYFGRKSWYSPEISADSFDENMLTKIEKQNIHTIKEVEDRAGDGYFFEKTGEPLFSIKEKKDVYENMNSYNTWKLSIRELNDNTNEYDSWTLIKDKKQEILATKKNGSNWSYYYYKEDVTRGDVYFDNTPGIMMAETWINSLLNPWEGVFNKFFPNYVKEENGDIIYTLSLEGNPRIEMFTFMKDAEGKYILKTVFITSSSPSYPDLVIEYELSNTPLEVE